MLRYESHTVEGRIGPNVLTLFYLLPHAKTINNSPQQCRTMSIFSLGISKYYRLFSLVDLPVSPAGGEMFVPGGS